jgi:transaldolase/glucose-6-phosphate isomerase
MNAIQEAQRHGQGIWLDYIRRSLLKSGEFQGLINQGISGVTSNPTIFEKVIVGSTDYDEAILTLAKADKDIGEIYETIVVADIQTAADLLCPIFDRTSGLDGYASLEVSPLLAHDTNGTIKEAKRLFAALDRPNVMIKVPATDEGIPAIRYLISAGINVNVTLIFSLDMYQQVMKAYIAGMEDSVKHTGNVVASVASFFLSRIDTAVDTLLDERIRQGQEELRNLLGKAAIANAKLAYKAFRDNFDGERFTALKAKGARVQRPLWASTGTKNPAYSDVMYVEPLIGSGTVNTMPPAVINAFLEHGRAEMTLGLDTTEPEQVLADLAAADISLEQVTTKLLADGVKAFADSFEKLMVGIEEKRARLLAPEHVHPGVSIGTYLGDVEATLADLSRRDVVARIWRKDHTVWKSEPTEIANRLGWLTITDLMFEQTPALQSFAQEVKETGFRHVILLGMGGSSLGPEVLRQTFGSIPGYPELIVLEAGACIVPIHMQGITGSIEPLDSLFLISSKSGSTIEPLSLADYFTDLLKTAVGEKRARGNFVAITDPESPLVRLAEKTGFDRVYLNPSDIGGRYSVLSAFGLVPAAITGIDIAMLLERAERMRQGCASCVPIHENPGAWLGACIASLASQGRDKLTLVTSPAISSYGLWVEQLIAESTGKEGKGVIPIVGEPLVAPIHYHEDRLFIYLRLKNDDNSATDTAIERIKSSGQPVITLEMQDKYDLGAEFYRWEFATAVVGAILGINPFDQPDVQRAKDATQRLLDEYATSGSLPQLNTIGSIRELMAEAGKGKYVAIMAYICQEPEVDKAFAKLRRTIVEKYGMATTLGYGPRFLHSTGQLHKGGPDSGLYLQITSGHHNDLPIPGKPYTFSVLANAQALGDFQSLQSLGRTVMRIHFNRDDEVDILKLVSELN